jgi:hypothetical protein
MGKSWEVETLPVAGTSPGDSRIVKAILATVTLFEIAAHIYFNRGFANRIP